MCACRLCQLHQILRYISSPPYVTVNMAAALVSTQLGAKWRPDSLFKLLGMTPCPFSKWGRVYWRMKDTREKTQA